MDNKDFDKIITLFKGLYDFRKQGNENIKYTHDLFKEIIDELRSISARQNITISSEDEELIKRVIDSDLKIYLPDSVVLMMDYEHDRDWYSYKKSEINPFFWKRYRSYLHKTGWTDAVLNKLEHDALDKIINLLGDPNSEEYFSRKGLVMGDVQSGKTSNYIGLMCKAADAGYKVIILLTGTIESLRRQTQIRVEEGFIGYDVDSRKWVGVGLEERGILPKSATSRTNDFVGIAGENTLVQLAGSKEPYIFITKKNATTLKRIRENIQRLNIIPPMERIDTSLLIIDDEADNASVNTSKADEDPSTINSEIRKLKDLFTRANYVGFTATPFANIFIDPDSQTDMLKDDLFPEDFIFGLSSPSNYFGAERMFVNNPYNTVQLIDDYNDIFPVNHKNGWTGSTLFPSLYESINCFLLVNAIRDLREKTLKNSHRSMLVNMSRFINVHNQIHEIISERFRNIKNAVKYSKFKSSEELSNNDLVKSIYEAYMKHYSNEYDWDTVYHALYDAIKDIEIIKTTSKEKKNVLDYEAHKEKGLRVIVVGGLTLSRGITLEGLCISYLYRTTQTFDVLMQMGRWFGYRQRPVNYEDLCKVWMLETTKDFFCEITDSIIELKSDLKTMVEVEKMPRDFGIRVRNESDELGITSSNKMRRVKKVIHSEDLYGRVLETPYLSSNENIIRSNYELLDKLLTRSVKITRDNQQFIPNIPTNEILSFLKKFEIHEANRITYFEKESLTKFIIDENYEYFDIVIINGSNNEETVGGIKYRLSERSFDFLNEHTIRISGKHRKVGGPEDTKAGLSDDIIKSIKSKGKYSARDFMVSGRNPLLMIYVLKLKKVKPEEYDFEDYDVINSFVDKLDGVDYRPISIAIGFPLNIYKSGSTSKTYFVNEGTKWWKSMNLEDSDRDE